jgi:hypothetical protein
MLHNKEFFQIVEKPQEKITREARVKPCWKLPVYKNGKKIVIKECNLISLSNCDSVNSIKE